MRRYAKNIMFIVCTVFVIITIISICNYYLTYKNQDETYGYIVKYKFVEEEFDIYQSFDYLIQLRSVGRGLNSRKEKFIGAYGNNVYRYSYSLDTGELLSCIRIIMNSKHTSGKIVIIDENGSKTYKKIDRNDINRLKQIMKDVQFDNMPVCMRANGDGGAFVCIETYINNTHNTIIRWDGNHDIVVKAFREVSKFINQLE